MTMFSIGLGGVALFIVGVIVGKLWERLHAQHERERLTIQLVQAEAEEKANAEKLQWVEQAQERMREAFEALASEVLRSNSDEFRKHAYEQVEALLNQVKGDWETRKVELRNIVDPLKDNLEALDGHVRELEQKREGAYQGLQSQLHQLWRGPTFL
jgi:DNA recombination protein RmuC